MEGRTWIVDNETWFSPNASHFPGVPPSQSPPSGSNSETPQSPPQHDYQDPPQFIPFRSKASDFQKPRWWNQDTEWMAFVPRQRVAYHGIWFETLAYLPNRLPNVSATQHHPLYQLPPRLRLTWNEAEKLLTRAVDHLSKENRLNYLKPFPPGDWEYGSTFASHQDALKHVEEGRNWFAMWLGLLYWLVRRTPEGEGYIEGLKPEAWVVLLIRYTLKQKEVDLLRLNPLLQRGWQIDRVGVFLHNPSYVRGQPPVDWFVHQGIPVWYRWGSPENLMLPDYSCQLMAPTLQQTREGHSQFQLDMGRYNAESPEPRVPFSSSHFDSTSNPWSPNQENTTSTFTPLSPVHNPYSPTPTSSIAAPTPILDMSLHPDAVAIEKRALDDAEKRRQARKAWDACKLKLVHRRERRMKRETKEQKQQRLQREQCNPTRSAVVFEWDWNYDMTSFVPRLVCADERVEIIKEHKKYGEAIYDSINNEWHCCTSLDMPKDLYAELEDADMDIYETHDYGIQESGSSELASGGANKSTIVLPIDDNVQTSQSYIANYSDENMKKALRIQQHGSQDEQETSNNVLDILTLQFGFVPPLPLPSAPTYGLSPQRSKVLVKAIGMCPINPDNAFFKTELANLGADFLERFIKGESMQEDGSWDISPESRLALGFSRRLSSIRRVKNEQFSLYMFDFDSSATVSWKIAVYSAAAALFVSRLDDQLTEEQVALELLQSGVPFRTLQEENRLAPVQASQETPSRLSIRLDDHKFDKSDYEFFLKRCESLLTIDRARAALLRGGIVWRVALNYVPISMAIGGPSGLHSNSHHMLKVMDRSGVVYVDDELTPEEYDVICGTYRFFQGKKAKHETQLSWFPPLSVFENCCLNIGRWSQQCEELYQRRVNGILGQDERLDRWRLPFSSSEWRKHTRGYTESKNAYQELEKRSIVFINEIVGQLTSTLDPSGCPHQLSKASNFTVPTERNRKSLVE
ncbi:hypothetical protein NP233_g11409 [Leucocoprinus birnbaumii]|uniref:Uncharacterized protein n=1 Tax=Leucocoprinus birnbaumii TaxID=56174 RepID=A0AAD5YR01_9AGAR|nr:hypothetical protein NP233_g11409 [Leucocoprinus birnbaumii]